MKLTETMLN